MVSIEDHNNSTNVGRSTAAFIIHDKVDSDRRAKDIFASQRNHQHEGQCSIQALCLLAQKKGTFSTGEIR